MNASLFDRARAERFAQLLDEANGGRRHHAHSRLDEELADLVGTGQKLQAMPLSVAPDPLFRRDLRAQLIATAERDGIGDTAVPEPRESLRRTLAKPRVSGAPGRPRARGAIVIGIAAGTLALSGVSVASGEAIPGDPLYGMKRSTERAQLALAGSDLSRGQLYLDFARTRLQEAYAVRNDEAGFITALRDMDNETQQGIRMLVLSAIQQHDTTALDAIDGFVSSQRMLVGQMLDLSTATGRQQVTESLALLTKVEQRATSARSALACGAKTTGTDLLGPILGGCAVGGLGQTGQRSQSTAQQPAGGQTGTSPTDIPQTSGPSASPSGTPTEAKQEDDGLLGELGRILGGLLGG